MTPRTTVAPVTVLGFDALAVENDAVRAVIIPQLGGRVWELHDRIRHRQWIWHRPDLPLRACAAGEPYDDVWAGGWEELFPNDAAGPFEGRDLPDHGEWWTLRWRVEHVSEGAEARLRLVSRSTSVRAALVKEYSLAADAPVLTVRYAITSHEAAPFHFLFKQHLPVAVTPDCELVLPGGMVEAVDPLFGTQLRDRVPFAWPVGHAGSGAIDLRVIPPAASRAREFVYVRDLPEGWCAVLDRAADASLRMDYEQRSFPFVWFFLSYGGWRDVYTAVLEPCTNMPKDLAEAVRRSQSARLLPGAAFETTLRVSLSGAGGLTSHMS